jgi:hypothetical protein
MSTPADEDPIASQGIEELAVRVVESTAILNRVIGYVKDRGLRAAGVPRYTPNFDSAKHVLDLPIYGPSNRIFELIEDKVALHVYELFNGGVTNAWRVQARNKQQPDEGLVDLFTMHTTVVSRSRCPPHCELGGSGRCDATESSACLRCAKKDQRHRVRPKEPARPRSRNQLHN